MKLNPLCRGFQPVPAHTRHVKNPGHESLFVIAEQCLELLVFDTSIPFAPSVSSRKARSTPPDSRGVPRVPEATSVSSNISRPLLAQAPSQQREQREPYGTQRHSGGFTEQNPFVFSQPTL